jgi:DNA-binding response OmpR family regulator
VIPPAKKASARVALVEVKDTASRILRDAFRQFGIECVSVGADATQRFQSEKFDACVVRLTPQSEPFMQSARTSPSNFRMMIYGLGGSAQDAMSFSKYGINAVFIEPLERQAVLKLVRSTQSLVMHEFRRYVRVPVITEVSAVMTDGRRFTATSQEISSGGMSLRSNEEVAADAGIEISFALLTLPRIWIRGNVTWRKPHNKTFGVRFDTNDERRLRLKQWVESYLEV